VGIVEDLESLLLFNEKAAELRASRFTQMASHADTGIEISFGHEKPLQIARIGPDDEALKAFLLTFRFFVQDNERCSIGNVAAAYERLTVPDERKDLVRRARTDLNDFLDQPTFIKFGQDHVFHRRILEVFLYGNLAHNNDDKREVVESWRATPGLWPIMYNEFVFVLTRCLTIIGWLEGINRQTFEELKGHLPPKRVYALPTA
jgi:hypothetical protein